MNNLAYMMVICGVLALFLMGSVPIEMYIIWRKNRKVNNGKATSGKVGTSGAKDNHDNDIGKSSGSICADSGSKQARLHGRNQNPSEWARNSGVDLDRDGEIED